MSTYPDKNIEDIRMESLFGEALENAPSAEETDEALRCIKQSRRHYPTKWLYYAAAIIFLPIIVFADVHIHFRYSRSAQAEEVADALNDLQTVRLIIEGNTIIAKKELE